MKHSRKLKKRIFVILSKAKNLGSSISYETLPGVYPEPKDEILRFAQDDSRRRAQDERRQRAQDDKRRGQGEIFDFLRNRHP